MTFRRRQGLPHVYGSTFPVPKASAAFMPGYSNSKSKRHLRWLVFGSSTYYLYAFVASILAALMSSLI
jgi:hypothetical protein